MGLQIGLIGCGGIAKAHGRGYKDLEAKGRGALTALADVNGDNLKTFKELFPEAQTFTDYKEMLKSCPVDAVDICLPHHLHADAILAACKAGKHWICEKPLCMTMKEAGQIEKATREAGVTAMCAHNQVFSPLLSAAKRMIDSGRLGKVWQIYSRDCFRSGLAPLTSYPWIPNPGGQQRKGSWRSEIKTMGGGELIDTGYHPTYRLLYLADSEIVEVMGMTSNHRLSGLAGEDSANVLVRFENGIVGHILTSWAVNFPTGMHMIHILAEAGEFYGGRDEAFFRPWGFEPARLGLPTGDTFVEEIAYFAECVAQKKQPVQSVKEGIDVLKVILKTYEMNDVKGGPKKKK